MRGCQARRGTITPFSFLPPARYPSNEHDSGAMRIVRFTIVAILGLVWGRQVLAVLQSDTFKFVVGFFIVIALVGTAFTIYRLIVRTRTRGGQHPAA